MKSIEERAKKYAPYPFNPDYILPPQEEYIVNQQRNAYIAGAKEQKAIDDERAKNAFGKACGWLSTYPWYNEVFEEFVKNIEK